MTTRTHHTVLVKVSSHKSGGRAKKVWGHRAVVDDYTDPTLTSSYFLRHSIGTMLTVRVMISGKRRLIKSVRHEPDAATKATFREVYREALKNEADKYDKLHGIPSDPTTIEEVDDWLAADPTPTPKTERESVYDSKWLDEIYIREDDAKVLETIRTISNKRHVAVMMIGPSGYGKTSIPEQKAKDWGMDFLRWDCATVRDPEEFFGFRGAVDASTMNADGETIFVDSNFTKAVEKGNVVIVLDELNRIDPYISNILFPLLDHAGRASVAGHDIEVGENVIFVATVNLGFQFTGTFTLDTALNNRFTAKILVGSLPSEIEKQVLVARGGCSHVQALVIVKLMTGLRKLNEKGQLSIDASTRVSIQLAEMIGAGLEYKAAVQYVIVNGISKEEAKLVLDQVGYSF